MAEYRSLNSSIGFADGEILSSQRKNEELKVLVRAWNEEQLEVRFVGVLGFREAQPGSVSDLVEAEASGDFWDWCVQRSYGPGGVPTEKLFQFIDDDDEPCLEVVAKRATIIRHPGSAPATLQSEERC